MSMLRTTRSANVPDMNIFFHNPTTSKKRRQEWRRFP